MSKDSSKSWSADLLSPGEEKHFSVPWSASAAVVMTIVAFLVAQILSAVILVGANADSDWMDTIAGQFTFVLLTEGFIMLTVWLYLRKRKATLKQLGYNRKPVWLDLGRALAAFAVYFVALLIVIGFIGSFTNIDLDKKQELGFDHVVGFSQYVMAFVSLVVLPPLVEETIFRGFLFSGLRGRFQFKEAAILTSVIFAVPHLLATSHGLLWGAGIDTFMLSLVLCYLREKTGSLWASIAVHVVKNTFAFLLYVHLIGL
jgi:membrane protease YdiL (CAAX protease family)